MKTRILVVDDYKANIEAMAAMIEADDIEVTSATNGRQALELISRFDFGLALLDVEMPDMNGLELAKLIRSVKKFKSLPIIFVTAHSADSELVFKGYESGAVDVLVKPLIPHIVREKIRTFVELAFQKKQLLIQVAEMQELRTIAESASAARGKFLANMSHEIRTPLNAILGYTSLIKLKPLEESKLDEIAEVIHRNGDVLLRLIDDILDFTKVDSGHIELIHSTFDLRELINDISETCLIRARDNNVKLQWKLPEAPHSKFKSDPIRIKQVLLNIIGNAIKFSSGKEVAIAVRFEKQQGVDDPLALIVSIKDGGIGLSPSQQKRLFSPFQQADAEISRKFGGTGLGLVISRKIAQALGGDVCLISSEEGRGSHFQVEFKLGVVKSSEVEKIHEIENLAKAQHFNFSGKEILIVDDISDNRNLIDLYLRKSGAKLQFAVNGRLGVQLALAHRFDIILMDIQMPEMDGFEATKLIREAGFERPIVALTAHAIQSEIELCISSGCNSVLTKPISFQSLNLALSEYLEL